jgi:hypothetical protein
MSALPEVTEVKRLTIRPGDALVIRLDRFPDMAEAGEMQHMVRPAFGDVPVLVLGPDADIEVVGQQGGG